MHTNIDQAIASVIERGEEVTIPNVFSAYFQRILSYDLPDGIAPADTNAMARAALISFERAMDKYPMPSRPLATKTKSKSKTKSSPNTHSPSVHTYSAKKEEQMERGGERRMGTKMFSAEVDQLRWDYQTAMLRATTNYDNNGCTCLSCGCLASLREKAALLAEQCENLERQLEMVAPKPRVGECSFLVILPTVRLLSCAEGRCASPVKTKTKRSKKTQHARAVPRDPYAPSTSSAMI
ncbi:hypothetical protein C8Q76DRAFT_304243 [Earliella scabrosa]|nr:hypothetical protein C8Q76DRAFT_304243 [Earliella scabrosa]